MKAAPIKKLPPVKFLRECFLYEEKTGLLFWKRRPLKHFCSLKYQKVWNSRWAGTPALAVIKLKQPYLYGSIHKVNYLQHRVIWKLMTGKEPPDVIDHRDRNMGNNKWENLRESSAARNNMNKKGWGKSGNIGVRLQRGRWQARIHKEGKCISLGMYTTKEQAINAYTTGAIKLYGEFASC